MIYHGYSDDEDYDEQNIRDEAERNKRMEIERN